MEIQEAKPLQLMMKSLTLNIKNYILLSVIILSQLHVFFRGSLQRVDWFLFIDHTRRIDYAVMYLSKHLIYIIYSYCLLFPKGIHKYIKVFIFILSIIDLLHYFSTSHIGFGTFKILVTTIIFVIYRKVKA